MPIKYLFKDIDNYRYFMEHTDENFHLIEIKTVQVQNYGDDIDGIMMGVKYDNGVSISGEHHISHSDFQTFIKYARYYKQ